MSTASDSKWAKAAADFTPEQRRLLDELRQDYLEATRLHVPNYHGGPNAGILAELIRMGWRKSN
jgi:hypothetical protein